MPISAPIQDSFNGGIFSPSLAGHVSAPRRSSAVSEMQNLIPMIQGPATRRGGTRFSFEVKDSAKQTALLEFEFSVEQAFIVEMGDLYMRFYKDNAIITETAIDITAITSATPPVVSTGTELVTNGSFAADTDWTKGTGWTISGGNATHAAGTGSDLTQTISITNGLSYSVTFIVSGRTAGKVTPVVGDTTGTDEEGNGTFTQTVTAGAGGDIDLRCDANFDGNIDDVSVALASTVHGYTTGDEVFIENVGGMVEVNQRSYHITVLNLVDFSLQDREDVDIVGAGYTTYTSGGTTAKIYEISTNYLDTDLFDADGHFEFRFTQSNDVMYIAHENYPLSTLIRTTDTSWAVSELTLIDGPYQDINTNTALNITPSGTTGVVTLTAASAAFVSTDVGRLLRMRDSADNWTWLIITAFTDTTHVTALIKGADFADTTATIEWRLGLWSDTTSYPATVWLYQRRLVASTDDRIDFTQINGFTSTTIDFTPTDPDGTVNADNAISVRLGSNRSNDIVWMVDHEKALLVGTASGEWVLRANTLGEAIAPDNITSDRATREGSAPTQAVAAGNAVLFIQRARRKLHEMGFNFEADGFRSPDMTLLAEDITNGTGGIVQMAYQQQPQSILWIVRKDGILLGFTYEREENVLAWHRHIIGGSFSSGDAVVEHVASIPSADTSRDELWLIVKRTINSVTRRYVEYMTPIYDTSIDQEDAVHVDSSLAYSGSAVTTVRGLNHLEAEVIEIYNEGKAQPAATVAAGLITIPNAGTTTKAQIGLPNTWKLQTLEIEVAGPGNTMQGKPKRIDRAIIRYLSTLGISISGDDVDYDDEEFTNFTEFGLMTALFSGDIEHRWPGDYDRKGKIYLKHSGPFPVTVQAIMPRVVTSDR